MSNSNINVQITSVSSNQEWTTDPDMIEFTLDTEYLDKAEKCIAFMQENDVSYMCTWWTFGYTLYQLSGNMDEDDKKGKPLLIGTDGQEYAEFEPEYRVEGCHAKVYKDGDIQAVLPFKHTGDELWCTVGNLADLKLRLKDSGLAQETIESGEGDLESAELATGLNISTPVVTPKETSIKVKYWDCYHSEYETVDTHQFDIADQRETSGQAYITIGALEGSLDDMLSVTMEVNTNPLNGIDHVPCAHVHFDNDELAVSLFKVGEKILGSVLNFVCKAV